MKPGPGCVPAGIADTAGNTNPEAAAASSHGRQALDAVARVLGIDALVLGSGRPYATPTSPELGVAAEYAVHVSKPHHLLEGVQP